MVTFGKIFWKRYTGIRKNFLSNFLTRNIFENAATGKAFFR